jgi:hypothetical protein
MVEARRQADEAEEGVDELEEEEAEEEDKGGKRKRAAPEKKVAKKQKVEKAKVGSSTRHRSRPGRAAQIRGQAKGGETQAARVQAFRR